MHVYGIFRKEKKPLNCICREVRFLGLRINSVNQNLSAQNQEVFLVKTPCLEWPKLNDRYSSQRALSINTFM